MSPRTRTALRWTGIAAAVFVPGGLVLWLLLRRLGASTASFAYPSFITKHAVTHAPADDTGWVTTPPRDLARAAGNLDVETYSLARAIGSETGGSASALEKAAIGWSLVNRAKARGWTVTKLATNTSRFGNRNLYGSQEHGRVMSTARDPTDADVYVATMLLSGEWPDPTNGSTAFFSPRAQRVLHEQWVRDERTTRYQTPEEIVESWREDGLEPVVVAGIDPERQTFFRPV